jgi:hypothetical protein
MDKIYKLVFIINNYELIIFYKNNQGIITELKYLDKNIYVKKMRKYIISKLMELIN